MLVDLRAKRLTGKAAEALLGEAHITVNKNAIHNDPEKPFVTSGLRLGTPAMTTRGFKEEENARNREPHCGSFGRPRRSRGARPRA